MIGRLNHVAIAVPDLEKACHFYRDVLGGEISPPQELPEHGVRVVFVHLPNTKIELMEPLSSDSSDVSPLTGFLEKHPAGGIHHVCFEVPHIDQVAAHLEKMKIRTLGPIKKGAHGYPVIFLHPKDSLGCLLELEQENEETV